MTVESKAGVLTVRVDLKVDGKELDWRADYEELNKGEMIELMKVEE